MDIVSFYTGEGAYKDFAEKLRASCVRFGITPHVEKLESTGVWARNNSKKPAFMQRKLLELKRPIIWCDADCEVCKPPVLLESPGVDFAAYNWAADPSESVPDQSCKVLKCTSGVLYFAYTPASLQLMYQWVQASTKEPTIPDDTVLDMVWARWRGPKIKHLWLPREYNRMDLRWPTIEPVINHVYRDGAIFTGAQTLEKDPWLGRLPERPLGMGPETHGGPGGAGA
ncbi:MAG: hypothetical protein DYG92_04800 [Leptolyngbya sp. PLA1]|nr:hypothetical protein [Leptolyngbya sp. PLA1]